MNRQRNLDVWRAFDQVAHTYEQASALQAQVATELFARMQADVHADQVWMDAGCGTGRLARRLAAQGARVWAVDQAPAMLAGLDAVAGIETLCLDLRALPLPPAMLDGWVSSFALHWLGPSVLPLLLDLLRAGGVAHVAVPVQGSLAALQQRCPGLPVLDFAPVDDWLAAIDQAAFAVAHAVSVVAQEHGSLRECLNGLRQMGGAQLGDAAHARAATIPWSQWRRWLQSGDPVQLDYRVLWLRIERRANANEVWSQLAARGEPLQTLESNNP